MRAASWIVAVMLVAFTPAQTKVVDVGTGPLLTFTTPTGPIGQRENVHFVVDLEATGPALEFWRTPHNAAVLRRLDQHRLLAASYGDPDALVVIDLAEGSVRELAPGAPHEFVAVHGDDVLHLGDPRPWAGKSDNFLYATPWRGGHRRRLCEALLDRVPVVEGNVAVAVGQDDRDVWLVHIIRARARRVWTAPQGATSLRLALSPAGQRLAVGSVAADGTGQLRVIDLGTGDVVASWDDLPIQVAPESSSMPTLEVGWHDDQHVLCSETRGHPLGRSGNFVLVRRNIASGEVADETAYAPIGLWHDLHAAKPKPARSPQHFTVVAKKLSWTLRRAGSDRMLATSVSPHGEVTIARDGRFAAVALSSGGDGRVRLFRSDSDEPRELAPMWAHSFVWLPAAP